MNVNVFTKYSIGDRVWVFRYISEDEEYHNWHYGIEERTIVAVRVSYYASNGDSANPHIEYFLGGLDSFEGENWFDEDEPEYEGYYKDAIFATKEEAEEYLANYSKEDEYEEDDDEIV